MTNDTTSLLAHLAWRFPGATEDVATEALAFILNKEERARAALRDLLKGSGASLAPIASAHTQRVYQLTKKPDLVAFDESGREVALIESKFWANLTANQPNGYLRLMMQDLLEAKNLLFVAPTARVEGNLWEELRAEAEREFVVGDTSEKEGVRSARVGSDGHRLMLTSWDVLLGRIEKGAPDADGELRQLIGLCNRMESGPPIGTGDSLINEAVQRARARGYISTDGLGVARLAGSYGKYIRLIDSGRDGLAVARIGVDFDHAPPLYLWFVDNGGEYSLADMERIRNRLELDAEDCLFIHLPDGGEFQSAVEHIVKRLKEVRDRLA